MDDFIAVYDDALDETLTAALIEKFEADPSAHQPGHTGHGVDAARKDSVDLTITDHPEWQPLHNQLLQITIRHFQQYVIRYKFLLAGSLSPTLRDPHNEEVYVLDHENFERLTDRQIDALIMRLYRPGPLILQKYLQGRGGYHHWHAEIYPRDAQCETLHRVLLFMFYLNDVEQGGETEFYYQQRSIAPRRGRMVIAPAGFTHTHKGHVPQSSDKWIVTSWILYQRAEYIFRG